MMNSVIAQLIMLYSGFWFLNEARFAHSLPSLLQRVCQRLT